MRGVENVILIPGLSHISAKFNDSNPKVVQVQCKRFISAALIEPLTRTIPSENKHSRAGTVDLITLVRLITDIQPALIFWLGEFWDQPSDPGATMGDCFLGERLSCRGLRLVRAITYTQGLDIFYLQNVVLAAAVNMTWGGGHCFKGIACRYFDRSTSTTSTLINMLLSLGLVHIVRLNGNI